MKIRPEVWDALKIFVPVAIGFLIVTVLLVRAFAPPPPDRIRFAAGAQGGAYYAAAEAYRDALAVHGIDVEILETAGTLENYRLLLSGDAEAALLQGGLADAEKRAAVQTLGGMFAEPLWVFVPAGSPAAGFEDLRDTALAMGPDGSGTRALVTSLQAAWGGRWAAPDPRSGMQAANALRRGEVDAVAFAASVDAAYVRSLLEDPSVRLLPMRRATALSMTFPALAPVELFQGVVDLGADIPSEDLPLIAAVAQLGVRSDLHPAIQAVLLEAAESVHDGGNILARPGVFPDPDLSDLPLSEEARRYYRDGPTFLRRYFSFGIANLLERAWVLLIPLATVMIPLVQLAPPVYRWRIRRKIYVWYNDLHDLERQGFDAGTASERQDVLKEIRSLQMEVGELDVPMSYNDELYRLRSHIDFVQALIRREAERDA